MNLEQLKKNVGQRVRLRPIARRFDEDGRELEQIDDVWTMLSLTDGIGVTLQNPRSGHQPVLGKDHIYSYASDGERDGIKHGFLTLHVQLFLRAFLAEKEPTPRPGEPALAVPLLMHAPLNSAWPLVEQTKFAAAREAYARSSEGIRDADGAFEQLVAELMAAADKLRGADPAVAVRRQQTYFTIAARTYGISALWRRSSMRLSDSSLRLSIWDRAPPFPGMVSIISGEPRELSARTYSFGLVPRRHHCWIANEHALDGCSSRELAAEMFQQMLRLPQRDPLWYLAGIGNR